MKLKDEKRDNKIMGKTPEGPRQNGSLDTYSVMLDENGQNALECAIFQLKFQKFSGGSAPDPHAGRGYGAHTSPTLSVLLLPRLVGAFGPSIIRLCPEWRNQKLATLILL